MFLFIIPAFAPGCKYILRLFTIFRLRWGARAGYNKQADYFIAKDATIMACLGAIAIIMGVSFAGDLLGAVLPLPVPGSIYALVIMLLLLLTRAVKLEKVRAAGDFLISLMPLMFISPSVGLMTDFNAYKDILAPLLIICLVSTLVVMAVTGRVSQAIIRRGSAKREAGR